MMNKNFIIDQVSWHTQKIRNYEFDITVVHKYFETILKYLQEKGLTVRILFNENSIIDDNTCIWSSDLTEEGMQLIKKVYGKWIEYVVDNNKPTDVSMLDRALKKIRG